MSSIGLGWQRRRTERLLTPEQVIFNQPSLNLLANRQQDTLEEGITGSFQHGAWRQAQQGRHLHLHFQAGFPSQVMT